jgi:hypothetical protein
MPGPGGGVKLFPIETMETALVPALVLAQSLLSRQFGAQPTRLAYQDFKRAARLQYGYPRKHAGRKYCFGLPWLKGATECRLKWKA